jgi:hypothetical protein
MGGPNSLSDRNPAKTHVFTNSCSEPYFLPLPHGHALFLPIFFFTHHAVYLPDMTWQDSFPRIMSYRGVKKEYLHRSVLRVGLF